MATMNTTITSQTHYVAVTDDMLTIREKRSFLPDSDTWGCLFGLFMILFLFWGSWHAVQAEMDDPGVVLRYFLAKKFRITGVDNPLLNFLSWVLSFGYFVLIGGFLLWVVLFVLIIGVPLDQSLGYGMSVTANHRGDRRGASCASSLWSDQNILPPARWQVLTNQQAISLFPASWLDCFQRLLRLPRQYR